MDFLDRFDRLTREEASAFLFKRMCEDPVGLCEELRIKRPILRFWSRLPGNPDIDGHSEPGYAYLLTDSSDVRYALEHLSMKSYSRIPNRYFLGEDDVERHEDRRKVFSNALSAVDSELIDHWIYEAVEEAWDLQLVNQQADKLTLNVASFSREAALRFCGRLYGLPRDQIVAGKFPDSTAKAFENFVWKIFARHFVEAPKTPPVLPHLIDVAMQALMSANADEPKTFTDHLIVSNYEPSSRQKLMCNRDLISNLIGGFQGFIDNAVSCTCIALDELLPPENDNQSKYATPGARDTVYKNFRTAAAARNYKNVVESMRIAQRLEPPGPWLPRTGDVERLPNWKNIPDNYDRHPGDASCVLAVGSAMLDTNPRVVPPVSEELMRSDAERYKDPSDLRMGYGFHRCVGLDLGDRLVAHILIRITTLNDISRTKKLDKQWSWIVKEYEISGTATPDELATKWKLLSGAEQPVSLFVPPLENKAMSRSTRTSAKVSQLLTSDFKAIEPSDLGNLSGTQFASMSSRQLEILTDRQLQVLNSAHISALGNRISVFSTSQLAMLTKQALEGLSDEQIAVLDAVQVGALLSIRGKELTPQAYEQLALHASRHAIRAQTRDIQSRPHAFSLWSASYDTQQSESYTCWPGLADPAWTARHCEPAKPEFTEELHNLGNFKSPENPGLITGLFKRPPSQEQKTSQRSNVLFTWFAQWVSDSFLRTDLTDRRRNQSNHHVDLCQLYGLNEMTTQQLRENKNGRLLSSTFDGKEYLPLLFDKSGEIFPHFRSLPYVADGSLRGLLDTLGTDTEQRKHLFATALGRGNGTFGYTAISTLFLREHNRICNGLVEDRDCQGWDDERLFQTARMILTVLLLKIVIEEYINHIAGPAEKNRRPYRLDPEFAEQETWYRPPRITLEFNLLYRWHSLVPPYYEIGGKQFRFNQYRMNNKPLLEYGLGTLLTDASCQAAGQPGLFNTEPELLAAEFQALKMSRDYKVGSYNTYRKHFGLPQVRDFRDLSSNEVVVDALKMNYEDPSNLEFMVGLYAEEPQAGRLFGNLMVRMLGYDAFTQTFTNPLLSKNVFNKHTFTEYGLDQIKKTSSVADLWERNGGDAALDAKVSFDL